jgi:hypothetical protein
VVKIRTSVASAEGGVGDFENGEGFNMISHGAGFYHAMVGFAHAKIGDRKPRSHAPRGPSWAMACATASGETKERKPEMNLDGVGRMPR